MTTRTASPQVLAAMPVGQSLRPVEIHALVGQWARNSVRHALRSLVAAGAVARQGADCNRRYRRIEPTEGDAR
jgi:hypothetical protein